MPTANNIHAILGTDEGRVKEAALVLSKKIAPADAGDFGLEIISGQADNTDHATQIVGNTVEALQTLPFFGGEKVIWLQGANFFGDSQTGKSQGTLEATDNLMELLERGIPSDVQFILSASEIDKRRSFYKKLNKLTKITIFDKVDISRDGWERQVGGDVNRRAQQIGLYFAPGASEQFVLNVGADTRQLNSEMEKLSLYVGDRPATVEDVRTVVASTHAGVIWEIGDALTRRNLPRTLQLIDTQLRRGENAIGLLLAAIVPRIRQLLYIRDLLDRHRLPTGNYKSFEGAINNLPASETLHFPRKKDGNISCYPHFLSVQACRNFTVSELKGALNECLNANLRLISSPLDPATVLSQLVTRILMKEDRSRAFV